MSDHNNLSLPVSPAKSQPGDLGAMGEISGRASQGGGNNQFIQKPSLLVPSNAQSMRYGDLVYLHVENVDGII